MSLTFDDARLSQADIGLPLFERHGVKATFYVLPVPMRQRLDQWKKAAQYGHEIGNHTVKHPCGCDLEFVRKHREETGERNALEDYTLERMGQELDEANDIVRRELGVTPTTFAYPCGQSYVGQGAQRRSYAPLVAERFLIARATAKPTHNTAAGFDRLQACSSSLDKADFETVRPLLDTALRGGGWLIFHGHEINVPSGVFQTTITHTLEQIIQYAKEHPELWLDTVENIGKHLQQTHQI